MFGLTLTAATARADLIQTFDLTYSGAKLGNSAAATATISLDLTLTNNPGVTSQDMSPIVTAFSITVSGASSGNGTFGLGAFNGPSGGFYLDTGGGTLDFTRELIGQRTSISPFGTTDGEGGDFGFLANKTIAAAPTATDYFQITTNGGTGEFLYLTSFRPTAVPEPGGLTLLLSLSISTMAVHALRRRYPAAIA